MSIQLQSINSISVFSLILPVEMECGEHPVNVLGPCGCPGCAGCADWPGFGAPPPGAAPLPALDSSVNVATSKSCFRISLVGPFSDFSIFTTFTLPMLSPSALKSMCLVSFS